MNSFQRLFTSLIGRKLVMALTGAALIAFLAAHMVGNVQIFRGQEAFNRYAELLKTMPGLLWAARIGLLFVFASHIAMAFLLSRQRRRARPDDYVCRPRQAKTETSTASRTMLASGIVILAFVVYHLLHFTLGAVQPEYYSMTDEAGRHDVYSMVILGFQNVAVASSYIVAIGALGFHLAHGARSLTQTLGLSSPRLKSMIRKASLAVVILLVAGFLSVPLAVLTGLLRTAK